MSRGYPDYFGVSTFYKFGGFVFSQGSVSNLASGSEYTLHELSLKGRIYNQLIDVEDCVDPETCALRFQFDLCTQIQANLNYFLEWQAFDEADFIIRCLRYDTENNRFSFLIREGFTFDYNYISKIYNNTGAVLSCISYLFYSNIE